jgi:hypothetical protein
VNKQNISAIWIVSLLLGTVVSAPVWALDLEVAYTVDDNVTRSGYKWSDSILSASLGKGFRVATGKKSQLVWRCQGGVDKYATYDKLSRAVIGVNGAWQFRSSGAFSAPTYSVIAGANYESYGSSLRGGTVLQVGASVLKPVTDRIAVTGIVEMRKRDASSPVFDTSDTSTRINLDYLLNNRITIYLTYNRLTGDMVIMAPWAAPYSTYSYKLWAYDDAFGGSWAAYLFDATTDVGTLGFNYKLNEKSSVDASILSASSRAYGGISYSDTRMSVAYLRRF